MITISSLLGRIKELASRKGKFSIGTGDFFDLLSAIVDKIQEVISGMPVSMIYRPDVASLAVLNTIKNPQRGWACQVLDQKDEGGYPYIYQYDGNNWNRTPFTVFSADSIERDLGNFQQLSALVTKLDAMKTYSDRGKYRFSIQNFNHSLEIYYVSGVYVQVIRGTIKLDNDGNLDSVYSMTDFVQVERYISANGASKWKYSKTPETSFIMPFSGFVDDVTIVQQSTYHDGLIVFDRFKNKFAYKVNSGGNGNPFGVITYYSKHEGWENYSNNEGTPRSDRVYTTNESVCVWDGAKMIEIEAGGVGSEIVDLTEINNAVSVLQKTGFKYLEKDTDLDLITAMGAYYVGTEETTEQTDEDYPSKDVMFVTGDSIPVLGGVDNVTQIHFSTEGIRWRRRYPKHVGVSPAYWGNWEAFGDEQSVSVITDNEIDNLFT
jgi:hypothetical protein